MGLGSLFVVSFCGVKTRARRLGSNGRGDEKSRSPRAGRGGRGRDVEIREREATNEGKFALIIHNIITKKSSKVW